jgi:hypothetical protein
MDHDINGDYMLFMLNTLGQAYHTSLGFNSKFPIIADMTDSKFISLLQESFDKNYSIKNIQGYNYYEKSEIKNHDPLIFDSKFLEEKSRINVTYNLVTLKNPNMKYPCYNTFMYLKTRQYIKIDNTNIVISSLDKWDSINIDDILFATSSLFVGANNITERSLVNFKYNRRNKFKIAATNNNNNTFKVILEPNIF